MRVFVFGFPFVAATANNTVSGELHNAWLLALVVLAIMTMTIGNVAAIVQNNVKRMLAYSSIAHAGYALVGLIAAGAASTIEQRNAAVTAVTFYLLTYAVMNIGAFAVVQLIARAGDRFGEFRHLADSANEWPPWRSKTSESWAGGAWWDPCCSSACAPRATSRA